MYSNGLITRHQQLVSLDAREKKIAEFIAEYKANQPEKATEEELFEMRAAFGTPDHWTADPDMSASKASHLSRYAFSLSAIAAINRS